MALTIITYHTGGMYADECERLLRSLNRLGGGCPVHVYAVKDAGDWYRNTTLKAEVIREAREELRGPLLYVDADAVFHRLPSDADIESAIGGNGIDIAMRPWFARWPEAHVMTGHLTGTILMADTRGALGWLRAWEAHVAERVAVGQVSGNGQQAANDVRHKGDWTIGDLPIEWCWIFDEPTTHGRAVPDGLIVEHLQASRDGCADAHSDDQRARRAARIQEVERWLS